MSRFRNHPIRGTKFYVYYGGADIDGSNKWVISTDPEDYDLLDAFMGDGHDQLWQSKEEAMEEVGRWLMSKAIQYINQSKNEDEYGI